MWFWNGLPNDARAVTGHLMAWGSDALTIAGQGPSAGRLLFSGNTGRSEIIPKTWNHVAVVRQGRRVRVYLNGVPEIMATVAPASGSNLYIGSSGSGSDTLEGKIDEVSVYYRALTSTEISRRHDLAVRSLRP
jgi:hypothetical protein